ncbi:MAG: adenine phosphoribosyltransferase [bacterium]
MDLKQHIREIPDWPKPGINFKDITTLLQDAEAFQQAIDQLAEPYLDKKIDVIVGIDARGFIFAAALAYKLKTAMAIIRKKGKLPWKKLSEEYALEYGTDTIEMHEDAIKPGQSVMVVDDLLATGGTMESAIKMIEKLDVKIEGVSFLIELDFFKGREKFNKYPLHSLLHY